MVPKGYKFSRLDDMMEEDDAAQEGGNTIQMDIPQSGRSYFFERLLVVDTPLSVNVAYSPPPSKPGQSLWDRFKSSVR